MDDAYTYFQGTAPASEGLFKLLSQYGWEKMRAFVALSNSKTPVELDANKENFSSTDIAREVIAGSILQIAYVAIARYAKVDEKSENALHFESDINRLIQETSGHRLGSKKFEFPAQFCVGRDVGHLPLGMIIYSGRNQYNHFYEGKRLSVANELVFNYLHTMWPEPSNGLLFDLKPGKLFSYSVLAALGWIDTSHGMGYAAYKRDMADVLQIEH